MILDGSKTAKLWHEQLRQQVKHLAQVGMASPRLDVILSGEDAASHLYVDKKQQACLQLGIQSQRHHLPDHVTQQHLLDLIQQLNQDNQVNGILVQLPLPPHIAAWQVVSAIDPNKDVDGLHPYHLGRLLQGRPNIRPCTPKGIMHLLQAYDLSLEGLNVTMVGHSNIVGKPMLHECLNAGATVTIGHRATRHLEDIIRPADVIITAIGQTGVIEVDWLSPDSVVIDVGMNRVGQRMVGDVDFAAAQSKVRAITPVPGGVGPMTVCALMDNTLQLTIQQHRDQH